MEDDSKTCIDFILALRKRVVDTEDLQKLLPSLVRFSWNQVYTPEKEAQVQEDLKYLPNYNYT